MIELILWACSFDPIYNFKHSREIIPLFIVTYLSSWKLLDILFFYFYIYEFLNLFVMLS